MNAIRYTTRFDKGKKEQLQETLAFRPDVNEEEGRLINLYPQAQYQLLRGFGGAFTDASGYVFAQMSMEDQQKFVDAYFGADGARYSIGRTSIDSCDFSTECYEADGDPADEALEHFSLERPNRYVLPLLRKAEQAAGKPIPLLLSPWSPPAYMKTNASRLYGGRLKPEYYGAWARYICRYIQELQALGLTIQVLTVQNEAKATQTWDSCLFTAEEEALFVRTALKPALRRAGLDEIELLIWDHNKERALERACASFADKEAAALIDGVAVHWYSGDHFEALRILKEQYPNKRLVFTEGCAANDRESGRSQLAHARQYAHEIIGDLNSGVDAFYDWNLLLDERGGPNHVGNFCDAPMRYNTKTRVLQQNLSFDYIRHFSRYLEPGARRIGLSRFGDALEAVAVQNPDGAISVVVLNLGEKDVPFALRLEGQLCAAVQEARSISTYVIRK